MSLNKTTKTKPLSEIRAALESADLKPSIQRVAVATYVLQTDEHPSAELVHQRVTAKLPGVSRATVYNTLHALVQRGLLREWHLAPGKAVYDPHLDPHHHFFDLDTQQISDLPLSALKIESPAKLRPEYDVTEYTLLLKGRRTKRKSK